MKTLRWMLAAGLLASLVGCVSSAAKLARVQIGMTKEQVLALLGPPAAAQQRGAVEYLTYFASADSLVGEQPYMVRFVQERVDTVGRFTQLPDLESGGQMPPAVGMGVILAPQLLPDVADQLRQLTAQHRRGELSAEEFSRARQALVAVGR